MVPSQDRHQRARSVPERLPTSDPWATIGRSIAPRSTGLRPARTAEIRMNLTSPAARTACGIGSFLRKGLPGWLAALLVALLLAAAHGGARADDYAPVNALLRSGQLDAALAQAEAYLAKNPRDPQMRFLKGLIQQDAGRLDAAMTTYQALITDYPELPEPYNNIAVLHANQGQLDKAREALQMAIRNKQNYGVAHENLGDIYMRLAGQSYERAQALDARNTTAAPKLALIRQMLPATR